MRGVLLVFLPLLSLMACAAHPRASSGEPPTAASGDRAPAPPVAQDSGSSQPAAVVAAGRAEATRLLSEADDLMKATTFEAAREKYQLLRSSYQRYLDADQLAQVDKNLDALRVLLNPDPAPQPAAALPGPTIPPLTVDDEAEALVTLLQGSFATDSQTETDPGLSWNAAPVTIADLPNSLYYEVSRTDDPANPFRQGILSLYRFKQELRLRLLDFASPTMADTLVGLWAAPSAFPKLGVEQLRPTIDLILKRDPSGDGYTGNTAHPFPTVRAGAVEMTSSIRLTADGLTTDDRGYNHEGKQVWAPHNEHGVVFHHVAPPYTAQLKEGGLALIDIIKGNADAGALQTGGELAIQMSYWTGEGVRLDSTRAANRPPFRTRYPFAGMKGLDDGLGGIAKGGRRRIIIPPALAFGEQGRGNIPPNTSLVFDIECLWLQAPPALPPGAPPGAESPAGPPAQPPGAPAKPPSGGH